MTMMMMMMLINHDDDGDDGDDTVDGQTPAPPRMMIVPLSIGFEPSQVVQDFFRPDSVQY